jgi:plastocyanin
MAKKVSKTNVSNVLAVKEIFRDKGNNIIVKVGDTIRWISEGNAVHEGKITEIVKEDSIAYVKVPGHGTKIAKL